VPSVASEVAVQSSKRPDPAPGRPGPSARTPSKPFDAVLDATTDATPRADRPGRSPAPAQRTRDTADTREPAQPSAAQPRSLLGKAVNGVSPADTAAPVSGQPAADAAAVMAEVLAPAGPAVTSVIAATAVTDKVLEAVGNDTTDAKATPDDAKPGDMVAAAATAATVAAIAPTPAVASAAITPAVPVAAIAIPVVAAVATDPASADGAIKVASRPVAPATPASADGVVEVAPQPVAPATPAGADRAVEVAPQPAAPAMPASADGEIKVAPQPAAPTVPASVEPAEVQSLGTAVAADAKAAAPADDAAPTKDNGTSAKIASTVAATVAANAAEPAPSALPAATGLSPRVNNKADQPRSESGRSERAAAPPRATSAPVPTATAQSADTTPDKPAAPAVHGHTPAPDHVVAAARAALSEARDIAPADTAPTQPNTTLPSINPPASAFMLPTLRPATALRVDAAPDVAVPIAGLPVEIATRAEAGLRRFDIRLDPPDLGRIDVRLDVDPDGRVTSRLIVERADTLDLLRRDAPSLERALQQAGLKTDGGIDFSLRDQSFREQAPRDNAPVTRLIIPDDEAVSSEAVRGYGRLIGLGGGVDIRV
jgi:flagellar hook-length control protein FliK